MADQRCPMCGKGNPADADVCEYCQARLKPLIISPNSENIEPVNNPAGGSENADSSLPDWLQSLKPNEEIGFGQEDDSLPDWLDESKEESESLSPGDELPDWLSGAEETPKEKPAEESGSGEQDWLSDFKQESEKLQDEESEPETPAWLGNFDEKASETSSEASESEGPDWLSNIRKQEFMGAGQEYSPEGPGEEGPPPEESTPAWADGSSQFNSWLNEKVPQDESHEELPSAEPPLHEAESEEGTPDWLQRIREQKEGEEEQAPLFEPAGEELAESPDWLSGVKNEAGQDAEEEVTDWLASGAFTEQPEAAEPADSVPDWLKSLPAEHGEDQPSDQQSAPADDWLQEIERSAAFDMETEETVRGDEEPAEPAEEIPDWLSRLEGTPAEKPSASVPALIFDNEEDLGPYSQDEGGQFDTSDMSQEPDWIAHVPVDEAAHKKPSAPEGTPEEDLERADLPGWLEAMRPVEAAAPMAPLDDETSTTVETSGPLQGMRGALPAQPAFGRLRKPPVQSLKLSISENQKSHIALLEGLLTNEDEPKSLPKSAAINSQALIRLVITAIMLIAVLGPLWFPQGLVSQPARIPVEVEDASRSIASIAAGDPVLVAFDYEASLAGEVEPAASALMNQLAAKEALITAVSTNISGPVLAARWLEQYNLANSTSYPSFYNLGYIPAGAAGLLGFASNPREVMPFDLQQKSVWNNGSLVTVQSVSDYHLVVVITDNAENARIWIEQVQPLMRENNVPLVIASSAQVEPMIRPYYDNATDHQVDGFVAGLMGGVAFENLTGLPGDAGLSWDSLGIGLLVAAVIILGGAIINGVLSTIAMVKKPVEEEEQ